LEQKQKLHKFGARIWGTRIMVTWGIVSSCMLFVTGGVSFQVMRFILGLAEASFFPGGIFYPTLWRPSRQRLSRTAWYGRGIWR
jgi:MFS family permease